MYSAQNPEKAEEETKEPKVKEQTKEYQALSQSSHQSGQK